MKRLRPPPPLRVMMLLVLSLSLSGCVYFIVGGVAASVGALGGYVISPDTVEGITSHAQADVWDAANEILSIMGSIKEAKEAEGIIEARVSGAKATVTISSTQKNTVRVTIKVRKGPFPAIAIAQDIYIKIMAHLNE